MKKLNNQQKLQLSQQRFEKKIYNWYVQQEIILMTGTPEEQTRVRIDLESRKRRYKEGLKRLRTFEEIEELTK